MKMFHPTEFPIKICNKLLIFFTYGSDTSYIIQASVGFITWHNEHTVQ